MPPLAQPALPRQFTYPMPPHSDAEFAPLRPGLWVWHSYDSSVKTELFSAALAAANGVYLFDPIPLADADLVALTQTGPIAAIVVTNANHQRAAIEYSDRFCVPVLGHPETLAVIKPGRSEDLSMIATDLEAIEIEGAVAGEVALYQPLNGGTLIVGDALINLEPYGFTFLPPRYCLDQKQMRISLRKLLPLSLERILFAHGTPIVSRAGERFRQLLDADAL
jgi:glyoxylase-like metal-dependent hydrolase (beta-lactamase superfamily II)